MQFRRSVTYVAGLICYLCTRSVPRCRLTNVAASVKRRPTSSTTSPHIPIKFVLVALVLSVEACAPVIAHGPDVRSGFSGGLSAVLGNGPTYENGDDPGPFYFGAVTASAAYGIRSANDSRPALRFGLQAPTGGGAAVDLYVQTPRKWLAPVAAGFGLMAEFSDGRQMPYMQAGIKNRDGFGLDVAIGRYSNKNSAIGYTLHERAQVNWLSFEVPIARWASLYLRGGFASGHVTKQGNRDSTPYVDEDRWVKLGGATLELHR